MLKQKFKAEELEKYNSSFISSMFRNGEADVVYKLKERNLFILIEHQTKIDYSMPYRILKYEMSIIESAIDTKKLKNKSYKIPLVIPIVIYTGRQKWNASRYLEDSQEKLEGIEHKIANYNIIDANNYTARELLEDEIFITKMLLVEKAKNVEEEVKYLNDIVPAIKEKNKNIVMSNYIELVFKDKIGKEKVEELIEKINGGGEKMLAAAEMVRREFDMTRRKGLLEGRREGIKQGIKEGREEGKKQGIEEGKKQGIEEGKKQGIKEGRKEGRKEGKKESQLKVAKNMIKKNMSIDLISEITELNVEEIQKIKNNIFA